MTPIRLATVRAPLLEEYKDGESEYSVGDEDERGDERVRSRWTSLDRQRVETGDVKGGFDEKAGIILVCCPLISSRWLDDEMARGFRVTPIGHPQYLHRDPAIPCNWAFRRRFRHLGPPQVCAAHKGHRS